MNNTTPIQSVKVNGHDVVGPVTNEGYQNEYLVIDEMSGEVKGSFDDFEEARAAAVEMTPYACDLPPLSSAEVIALFDAIGAKSSKL